MALHDELMERPMHRVKGQLSFADEAMRKVKSRAGEFLHELEKMLDWSSIERKIAQIHDADVGRPAYPPLVLMKMLLLQSWFSMSDVQTEDQARDRISFRRFLGLSIDATVPDHSTISRFRDRLEKQGVTVLEDVNRQFAEKGLSVKIGTIVDASLMKRAVAGRKARRAKPSRLGT